jgi:hypothetical protein
MHGQYARTFALCGCAFVIVIGAAEMARAGVAVNPYPGYESALYSDPANWLCHPDKDDACDHDLDATVVYANGDTEIEPWQPAAAPAFDCFYVYPTISTDPGGNSDLIPGEAEEISVVRLQAARLGSTCRLFAPMYRQVTLTALLANLSGTPLPSDSALADADLVDAWRHYIANENDGRGVLLIGHSQGSSRLTTLLRNEVDLSPELRDRLVSAMLLGSSFQVPEGADVGASLANIPLCHSDEDIGCVISYVSFRATAPPPSTSFFGRSQREGWKAACTNPAALSGGSGVLQAYFAATSRVWIDPALGVPITTPWVRLPDFIDAECAERDGFVYLELTVHGDRSDPRADNIPGDLTPQWGMHLIDVNVAQGNLVAIAESQGRAYQASHQAASSDNDGCAIRPGATPARSVMLLLIPAVLLWWRRR